MKHYKFLHSLFFINSLSPLTVLPKIKSQEIMGSHKLNFTPTLFFVPFCFFFLLHIPASAENDICGKIDCGRGTCVGNSSELLGFDCVCYQGWKQFQLGPITLPPCVIPNCTLNFHCGSNAPAPPSPPPPFNPLDPCNIAWCGDGTCHPDGIGHSCQCFEGSANFLNMTSLPCFKKCSMGADCSRIDLGSHSAPTPPPQSNGSKTTWGSSRPFCAENFVLLAAIILVSTLISHAK